MIPINLVHSSYDDTEIKEERATYGVSKTDVWQFDIYLAKVISNGLKELARQAHGWPQCEEFPTFEVWVSELQRIAALLDCYTDVDGGEKRIWNSIPWTEEDHQPMKFEDNGDGTSLWIDDATENELLWREEHSAHEKIQHASKDEALAWVVKWWGALWD